MKILLLIFLISSYVVYGKNLKDITITKREIPNIFNPKSSKSPKLEMIINQKAKINGKWYQINQKVAQYKIIKIEQNSVTLKNAQKTLVLHTYSKRQKDKE